MKYIYSLIFVLSVSINAQDYEPKYEVDANKAEYYVGKFNDNKRTNFKEKKKFFKKDKNKKLKFNDKKKSFGFTNNPEYFGKKTNEVIETDNKRPPFKKRKKFKKRQRPKKFSFRKHRRK